MVLKVLNLWSKLFILKIDFWSKINFIFFINLSLSSISDSLWSSTGNKTPWHKSINFCGGYFFSSPQKCGYLIIVKQRCWFTFDLLIIHPPIMATRFQHKPTIIFPSPSPYSSGFWHGTPKNQKSPFENIITTAQPKSVFKRNNFLHKIRQFVPRSTNQWPFRFAPKQTFDKKKKKKNVFLLLLSGIIFIRAFLTYFPITHTHQTSHSFIDFHVRRSSHHHLTSIIENCCCLTRQLETIFFVVLTSHGIDGLVEGKK